MASINPYLNFPGTTEEAFNFYKSVFGGEFLTVQRFRNSPEGDRVPEQEKDKIMHISLPVGSGNILMATDALESMGHKVNTGNNFQICISPDSEDEATRIFNALSNGGKIIVPMGKTSWGAIFGMFIDKYGVQWMVNYDISRQA